MKIGILALISSEVWSNQKNLLVKDLINLLNLQGIFSEEVNNNYSEFDYILTFVITGGTEKKYKEQLKYLKEPYIIIAHPLYNSLPASLEIKAYLGSKGRIFLFNNENIGLELKNMLKVFQLKRVLKNKTLALIGKPSFWLIASSPPIEILEERFSLKIKEIPLDKLLVVYGEIRDEEVMTDSNRYLKYIQSTKTNSHELIKALKLKKALEYLKNEYGFDYFSLECFSLINSIDTTGCLALSLFNDQGVVSGCEGDLPSTLTMILLKELSQSPNFLGNISWVIDKGEFTDVTLTHCTVSTAMSSNFYLTTHFETEKGVGIKGYLPIGTGYLVRIGGERLEKIFFRKANLINNQENDYLCRTQLSLLVEKSYDYFIKHPLGNHHIWSTGISEFELEILSDLFNFQKI